MSTQFDDEKASIHQLEQQVPTLGGGVKPFDDIDRHLQVRIPASLANLSPEELAEVDRQATRKLDILLLPVLVSLYILNYLDRQNISSAKIAGITKTLHLSAVDYSTVVSVLFAGYVSLQVPSNMLASKVKYPGMYICIMCALWGVVSACTGTVHSFAGLAVCRTVLGFCEAAFFPGAVFLLSTFYEKKKMALRTAIMYSGSQIGNAFGGLFALAILRLDGKYGLEGWRWLFIVEGVLTVGLALIFATFIPNKPHSIRWLTPTEKDQLEYRLEVDRAIKDATDEVSVGRALVMALSDPKTWLLGGILQVNYIAASVTNFFPIVVAGLGFDRTTTLAITAPPYVLCCGAILINGWHSDKKQERTLHIILPFIVTIVANILALSTTKIAPRYVAMCLLPSSFYSASIVVLSWISSAMTGPHVKRAVVFALINATANTPNIWTSYLYGDHGPHYTIAFSVDLAASVLVIVAAAATHLYLKRQNAKIERGEKLGKSGPTAVQIEDGFRYQL
ncbi:MAG: hypothetical protein TREMPRED_005266 [Tremellales sp. Tagirdzhanova-0007]|nr:MAG: hypothetical protein TREMPRED_005266 [Tremellales sp. Tagirdzhanova-0007]